MLRMFILLCCLAAVCGSFGGALRFIGWVILIPVILLILVIGAG